MKWSHKDQMEQLWIRQELGNRLFEEINLDHHNVTILRSNSQSLPGDIYKRCDIYTNISDERRGILFALTYTQAKLVEKIL
jgi:hypothetical protein